MKKTYVALSISLLVWMGSCFHPEPDEGVICGETQGCPPDMVCDPLENRCKYPCPDGSNCGVDAGTQDLTPPETALLVTPAELTGSATARFEFSANEASVFHCRVDQGEFAQCTSPHEITVDEGVHTFFVYAVDLAGNQDMTPAQTMWRVDMTPPETSFLQKPPALDNSAEAMFVFQADEPMSTFECSLDGAAFSACQSPHMLASLTDGEHMFSVRARDAAGNADETPAEHTWMIDLSTPDTVINTGPQGPVNTDSATFTFRSDIDTGVSFECEFDGSGYATCTSPLVYESLVEQCHEFRVRTVNQAGTKDPTPAVRSFCVDLTPPVTTLSGTPALYSNETMASVVLTASEDATFTCALDSEEPAMCLSPYIVNDLVEGDHEIDVWATDLAGNVELEPVSYAWTVDITAPGTTISLSPPGRSNLVTATVDATSDEDGVTFECSLDSSAFAPCELPIQYSGLSESSHVVEIRAVDRAGNVDATPALVDWIVDLTPPDTQILSGPSGVINNANAIVVFTATEASTFECRLDSGAWDTCVSSVEYTGLGEGAHTVYIRAVDIAGNVDASPASASFTVDVAPPETTVTDGVPALSQSTTASFTFTASEADSEFACRLDDGAWEACLSPQEYTGLGDGAHTFSVRATDAAGNMDLTPATWTWTVDTGAPVASITAGPSGTVALTSVSFSFSAGETGGTFECKLDSGSFAACTSPVTYDNLGQGAHTFSVRAKDPAGNVGAAASRSWTVDTVACETAAGTGPASLVSSRSTSVSFTANEAGSSFACRLDSGSFVPCTSPYAVTVTADGAHSLDVRCTDPVGNTDASPITWSWTVDTVAPVASITAGPSGTVASTSASFSFSAGETGGTFECKLDSGSFAACASPVTYNNLGQGLHSFSVRAIDRAGNVGAAATRSWTVDTVACETTVIQGPASLTNSANASFSFSANETGSTFECKLDGGGFAACGASHTVSGTSDGLHTLSVRCVDPVGNADASPATWSWTVDTAAPDTGITTGPSGTVASTSAIFSFSATEEGSTFQCKLDSQGWGTCASPAAYENLGQGAHTFSVRAIDRAGNVDASPATRAWSADTVACETTITVAPASLINSRNTSFSFSADETGSTFECKLDSGSFASCSSPYSVAVSSDGAHTLDVRCIDPVGNLDISPATGSWSVDTVAPVATITKAPSGTVASTSATLEFIANETGSTFQCSLDSGSWTGCASPASYSSLGQGAHSLRVRAIDRAGNVGTAVSSAWSVDTVGCSVTINAGPASLVNSRSTSFSFSTTETGGTFRCAVDSGSDVPCSSPYPVTVASDGAHSFAVVCIDSLGNWGTSVATRWWTVDTVAPDTGITAGPSGTVASTAASFSFSATETGSTFQCQLDGGSWSACSSSQSYSSLSQGSHTFGVRAVDPAGNTDASPATRSFTVDTVAPDTSITAGPSGTVNSTTASFSFSATEAGSTFQCQLDSGSWSACTSAQSYSGLSQGLHTFSVRAMDSAGNVDGSPATRTWTVDTVGCTVTITAAPASVINSRSTSFSFSSGETGSSFRCQVDSGSFAICTSPHAVTVASDGAHSFGVVCVDSIGNWGTNVTRSWTVDTVVPDTSITAGPSGTVASTTASFSFSATEAGSTFQCQLDSGAWAACTSPKSYSSLSQGAHTFRVRAIDSAGNTDASPATRTWTVDTVAPDTTITAGPSGWHTSTTASFSFSASEAGSTFECKLDSGSWAGCTSSKSYSSLSQGAHTFSVRAKDSVGNTDATPATRSFTVDTVAPDTTITAGPSGTVASTSASFSFSATETGSTFQCKLDSGSWAGCTSSKSYTLLSQGSHTFSVRATDAAGNTDASPATRTWTVDTVAPDTSITAGPSGTVNSATASFSFTSNETGTTFECKLDSGSWTSCTSPQSYSSLSQGSHTFSVRARDIAGNTDATPATRTWTVDSIPDTIITSGPSATTFLTSASFIFTSTVSGSAFQCRLDGGSWSWCSAPMSYSALSVGTHTFDVRAITDAGAGTVDPSPASWTWTILPGGCALPCP